VFTFIPESCSDSPRNTVRIHPGIAFTLDRNPHRKAADAAKVSADAARDQVIAITGQFELAERPWLSIVRMEPTGNLRYDGRAVHVNVAAHVNNVGNSTAVGMTADASLAILAGRGPEEIITEMIGHLKRTASHEYGIFRNDSTPIEFPALKLQASGIPDGQQTMLVIVTGVVYRNTFNRKIYFTCTVHNFGYRNQDGEQSLNGVPFGHNISKGDLIFTRIYPPYVYEIDPSQEPNQGQPKD